MVEAVRPFARFLQTVGLEGYAEQSQRELADALAELGASRITSFGKMPWPPLVWHHDGQAPLGELIRFADLDP